jgi:catechol 2,3-dioxygenase-like lactoylglutathione lyase family enzyme
MARLQLALNVSNLEESVAFYSRFFDCEPAKLRPGYANFALVDPPLKLVLIEDQGAPGTINHLGVEVTSREEVLAATEGLAARGFATDVEDHVTCCYALQDKVWVTGPDAARWEVYTVVADAPLEVGGGNDGCCGSVHEHDACCAVAP